MSNKSITDLRGKLRLIRFTIRDLFWAMALVSVIAAAFTYRKAVHAHYFNEGYDEGIESVQSMFVKEYHPDIRSPYQEVKLFRGGIYSGTIFIETDIPMDAESRALNFTKDGTGSHYSIIPDVDKLVGHHELSDHPIEAGWTRGELPAMWRPWELRDRIRTLDREEDRLSAWNTRLTKKEDELKLWERTLYVRHKEFDEQWRKAQPP